MKTIEVNEIQIKDFLIKINELFDQLIKAKHKKSEKKTFFNFLFKQKDNEKDLKLAIKALYIDFFTKVIQRFFSDLTGEQSNNWLELYKIEIEIKDGMNNEQDSDYKELYECKLEAKKEYQRNINTIRSKNGKEFFIYGFSVDHTYSRHRLSISQFDIRVEMMEITSLGYIDQFVPFQLRINLDKDYQPLTTLG